ncbi:MAG: hypothetical protein WDO56_29175 [Gammaproteobacteria bacterium]
MFLTAVLNAHTDKAVENLNGSNQQIEPDAAPDTDTDHIPSKLKAALAVPAKDRTVELPSIHRSRWV